MDEDTLEHPTTVALRTLIGLPIYAEALPNEPNSAVLTTGISMLRSGSYADLGMRFMWQRRDLSADFAQVPLLPCVPLALACATLCTSDALLLQISGYGND